MPTLSYRELIAAAATGPRRAAALSAVVEVIGKSPRSMFLFAIQF